MEFILRMPFCDVLESYFQQIFLVVSSLMNFIFNLYNYYIFYICLFLVNMPRAVLRIGFGVSVLIN